VRKGGHLSLPLAFCLGLDLSARCVVVVEALYL